MRQFLSLLLLFVIITTTVYATSDNYTSQWKTVEEHLEKQRPKSALEIVESIYKKARKERNEEQIIKSASYRIGLSAQLTENSELELVRELKQEISNTSSPLSLSVYTSLLGEVYWNYYLHNSWKFSQRTKTQESKTDDYRTWDSKTLRDTARFYYFTSISNPLILRNSLVKDFSELFTKYKGYDSYRPTLFDILSHRTIDFLQQSQTFTTQATTELTDLSALAELDGFINDTSLDTIQKEKSALEQGNNNITILKLFRELLKFHRTNKQSDALIDADILRLQFAESVTAHEDKDSMYVASLTQLANKFSEFPSSTNASYLIAQGEFNKQHYSEAMELCKRTIQKFPTSRGGINCKSLQSQILQKELSVSVEKTHLPNTQFISTVTSRNILKLYFRIVKTDNSSLLRKQRSYLYEEDYQKTKIKKLLEFPLIQKWEQTLPVSSDYLLHTVDIISPKLPLGEYALLVSPNENFSFDSNSIAFTSFTVTRFSLQSQTLKDGSMTFYVLDAQSGEPISGVTAKITSVKYDYNTRNTTETLESTNTTDKQGTFLLKAHSLIEKSFRIDLTLGNDYYSTDAEFYQYDRMPEQDKKLTLLFTDRQLYRPGQTIYFKGIIYKNNNEQAINEVVKNEKTTVYFTNTNSKEVAKIELQTNDFGSFSGSFIAPNNGLTGRMTIRNESGNQTIRVEEYKRPKFEVVFNSVKGNIELGKQITATGKAIGFAGANIGGATVQYHVTRTVRYPYYRFGYPQQNSQGKEITHGTTETNSLGEFSVEFNAIPDKSINRKSLPVFSYSITADITDINGETHSSQTVVSAGYISLELGLRIGTKTAFTANKMFLNDNDIETFHIPDFVENLQHNIIITSNNINNSAIPANGTLLIQELKQHERKEIIRTRHLPPTDQYLVSKEEYISAFPYDSYKQDNIPSTWSVGSTVESKEFTIDSSGTLTTGTNKKLSPGMYRVTISSIDISGEKVEVVRNIILYDSNSVKPPVQFAVSYIPLKINCQPGENATFNYGTSFKSASVYYQLEYRGEIIEQKRLEFSNEIRRFTIPIIEKYRGGISTHFTLVHDGRMYTTTADIRVPWNNKNLKIETATFRDKLSPGEKEQWQLTIKNNEGNTPIAEMIARFYDASLDAITPNDWQHFSWNNFFSSLRTSDNSFRTNMTELFMNKWNTYLEMQGIYYNRLNLDIISNSLGYRYRNSISLADASMAKESIGGDLTDDYPNPQIAEGAAKTNRIYDSAVTTQGARSNKSVIRVDGLDVSDQFDNALSNSSNTSGEGLTSVKTRSNFNETAFFFPQMMTDSNGSIILNFTIPEALTRWKMTAFAHTPDMQTGELVRTVVTQKDLMIEPNMPRFLRAGDTILLPVKITNLTTGTLTGETELTLFDAYTMKPVNAKFGLTKKQSRQEFTVSGTSAVSATWQVVIPESFQAVVYKIVAKSGSYSDGEEAPIPILPNRMMVTETLPLWINNSSGTKTNKSFEFTKLKESNKSNTLRNHKLTLEMTNNPAWYAIQALPLLMEFPHECSEQTFNRYYANSIAFYLVNSKPKIKQVFDKWKECPDALSSNLEKNQELKSLLLTETPWVMEGQNETERKKRVALLFDLNRIANEQQRSIEKLQTLQQPSGGFGWFGGMNESSFITNYILAGFGHLKSMNIHDENPLINRIISSALRFSDLKMNEEYLRIKSQKNFSKNKDYCDNSIIQYLYARSYFPEKNIDKQYTEAYNFWMEQVDKFWTKQGLMSQAMIALTLLRTGEKPAAKEIIASINERAIYNEELGMYWKENEAGWMWYSAPIETQALLIEAFDEVINDSKSVELMKLWLLKQKQVQDWKTTKATAEACFALLRRGTDFLESDEQVSITLGGKKLDIDKLDETKPEAGTGYFKTSWNNSEITPNMGEVELSKSQKGIAWGGVYWQYYEQLDKITQHTSPLSLVSKLFRRTTTNNGYELTEITSKTPLKVGDVLIIKLDISTDRDMEFIHLKDMRGAGFEQLAQLSEYKWQDGLGYYQSPRDASMNFFIGWMSKGIYSLEYPLRVTHEGTFSTGISTIQSMYAPEFSSNSAGKTINVGK
ncbi:MAG: hypothetical protein JST20_02000 [Bacteroidetes bacterium]|nr:hypothetical protein [Bacteroidota bacterium]